ncbi:MAG: metal ABC transporter ATP-binding protein [Gammaproteobacteria bacterium]|nr:metal ABC transporter ATP-binding protein [Gammaproteobacteria bacterium]
MSAVISIRNLWFSYNGAPILEGVTLDVERGEFIGLIGPNAGGKSTLLKLMLGLLEPSRGSIEVLGTTPHKARGRLGYVPQHAAFARDFPISVEETVMLGRLGLTRMIGGFSRHDREQARAALAAVEIESLRSRGLNELSGGQLQRVLIARALACDPEVLLLDEPTANIDMRAEEDIFALLKGYKSRMTIIVVSHDIAFISTYVSRVACLNRKLVCHQTAEIDGKLIDTLYGTPVHMIHHEGHGNH